MSLTSSMPCNLCGNQHVDLLSNQSRNGGTLQTVICTQCGLIWSDPFPHDPRQFYQDDYRLAYKNSYTPKPRHALRAGKVALERHDKIKHLLAQPCRFLDVGTGGGEFAYLIQSLGHDMHGIEPNTAYAEYSRNQYGLNLQTGFIQDAVFDNDSFDVITIWHVLEHTENPSLVLQKLAGFLKPDGCLVVEVPNAEATCQSPHSTFHEAHLFNFNFASLSKMGEKAGLRAEQHQFSDDQGNVTVFFRKAANPSPHLNLAIPDNADKISGILRSHSHGKHYCSVTPYLRFIRRQFRSIQERLTIKRYTNNRTLLDALYQSVQQS
ncbi:MAG: class I SAM-dependent methyltransferase [Methylomonas sp.]|nr:class I SAM-dependent methyltransferase [Methylomonas sp.]PPD21700.1 MAG: methyltransferase type 11 [Methylomonas sp.]PPD25765.1 MAG: methyltransferase type 11 [Methylomonas sp.]PPD37012.1 MAG: methyltransferase type 11 [Methylomonas sp.]PPD40668.1 MAG: methyltransferase type 11 [Methylomonas sp.]